MPVCNAADYVAQSIESMLRQTFQDFAFLIVQDGSSDNTSDILSDYACRDSRIHILTHEKNIGLTKSLNQGIGMIDSEFIARMDADDLSLKNRLKAQFEFLKGNDEYALVGTAWREMSKDLDRTIRDIRPPVDHNEIARRILVKNTFCHSSVMIRRKALLSVGGYNEKMKYAQDYDLWLRIILRYSVFNINKMYHIRRIHENNLSKKNIRSQLRTMARSQQRFLEGTNHSRILKGYVFKSYLLSLLPNSILHLMSSLNAKYRPF